ncbi:MAG: BamA/TamA family outer membrane protein [Bacteroidales bacterium]|nr:BamA/TamA family outer membrane protein [Bacteroidales bacterium]
MGKQQRKVVYHCYVEPPYFIDKVEIDITDSTMLFYIDSLKNESLVKTGDQYNLEKLKEERVRIDKILKNKGYFYFSPDYLLFRGDTINKGRKMDLHLTIKSGIDKPVLKAWNVNNIKVIDNSVTDSITRMDAVKYKGVSFFTGNYFKPKHLRHLLLFDEGELLTTDNYRITNKNISSLAAFKYASLDVSRDSSRPNFANVTVNLTPNELLNFKSEVNLVAKSNDFAGPGAEVSLTNRNLLGGGEQLIIKANSSIEAWLSKKDDQFLGNYNYELGASAELRFPRFLLLNPSLVSAKYVPNNSIMLESRFINQMQFYKMSFFRLLYGYHWAESAFRNHELNIIDITFQHLLNSTTKFNNMLAENSLLEQSFSDQFLIGTNYTYRYGVPDNDPRRFKTAFTGSLDVAGNLLYGIQRISGKKETEAEPLKFLGTAYAQYVKTTVDYRMYLDISRKDRLAARIGAGIGLPVGNSGALPGIKQYYLGGANNLRAFRFRSVGPGAYAKENASDEALINHSGEIMLLANLENRFKLSRMFEWALFLDAGNIWLASEDIERIGAEFNADTFLKQLAIGWGTGIRYLNPYFIIRVDVGFPLHSPKRISAASDKDAVFHFAIGYPF